MHKNDQPSQWWSDEASSMGKLDRVKSTATVKSSSVPPLIKSKLKYFVIKILKSYNYLLQCEIFPQKHFMKMQHSRVDVFWLLALFLLVY